MKQFSLGVLLSFGVVLTVYGATTVDECKLAEERHGPDCCKGEKKETEEDKKFKECMSKNYPENDKNLSEDEKMALMECVGECFLNSSNALTPDNEISKELIMKWEPDSDPTWETIDEAVVEACIKTSAEEVKSDAKCKSGSIQFLGCISRERFLKCPKKYWTDSEECNKYRSAVEKCPNVVPGWDEDI